MTPEVQARLFEPFFTTKDPGKGTGLGLSTVYGIVQQSGGIISVHSTVGLGTSFRILFPAVDAAPLAEGKRTESASAGGSETILLVEDESAVRRYVRGVLEEMGYRVLDAGNGADALQIARGYGGAIHLLLTDVALPGMNGNDVIREFRAIRPGTPAMRMSGYSEKFGERDSGDSVNLQKPFTPELLLRKIRHVLDAARG
jgi:CheY-like chemotaxis protein